MIIPGKAGEGLLPHQLEAFEAITNKFEESNKAAVMLFAAFSIAIKNQNRWRKERRGNRAQRFTQF